MRTIDLTDERLDLDAIIAIATDEPVILLTPDGKEFFVSEADDFEKEVDTLRASVEFQRLLDERSQTTKRRFALDDIEFEIEQELQATKARGSTIENQNRIPIGISLTNLGSAQDARLVYQFIADHAQDYEFYAHRPGTGVAAAAIDSYLILGSIASVASIVSLLWKAYEKFIVPNRRGDKSDEGIYVAMRQPDGTSVDVWLGKDVHTYDDFSMRVELMVNEAANSEATGLHKETITEIESSGLWIKIDSTKKKKH